VNESDPPPKPDVDAPEPKALSPDLLLLKEHLTASNKVARRLAWSVQRIDPLFPIDATKVDSLSDEEEERLDAFLYRFNSLTAMIQDHIARAIFKAEEEDITDRSRKDQRLLLEKLGALKPQLDFGTIAELRNRVAHHYPDDSAKQAEILNEVFKRAGDLIEAYNGVLTYADGKQFKNALDLHPISIGSPDPAP
jgi:hypothetical protein